jgi:hypothetical protein
VEARAPSDLSSRSLTRSLRTSAPLDQVTLSTYGASMFSAAATIALWKENAPMRMAQCRSAAPTDWLRANSYLIPLQLAQLWRLASSRGPFSSHALESGRLLGHSY